MGTEVCTGSRDASCATMRFSIAVRQSRHSAGGEELKVESILRVATVRLDLNNKVMIVEVDITVG